MTRDPSALGVNVPGHVEDRSPRLTLGDALGVVLVIALVLIGAWAGVLIVVSVLLIVAVAAGEVDGTGVLLAAIAFVIGGVVLVAVAFTWRWLARRS